MDGSFRSSKVKLLDNHLWAMHSIAPTLRRNCQQYQQYEEEGHLWCIRNS